MQSKSIYIRNFIFGVEDSLASTVGLLSGVAAAGVPRITILVTGLVLIFVEAVSMAIGSFLSEESAEEVLKRADVPSRMPLRGGIIMFLSYFVSGFIPLFPYAVTSVNYALPLSIILTLVALFALGIVGAKFTGVNKTKHGFKMLFTGSIAIVAGILVGRAFKSI